VALQQLGGALLHLSIDLARLRACIHHCFFLHTDSFALTADPATVFDLELLPNLRTLDISDAFPLRTHDFDPNQFMRLIKKLAAPKLERLSLNLLLRLYGSLNWTALDQFLSTDRFPAIRSVVLVAPANSDKEFFRRVLPLLETSGILEFN
jgi:hypothetical protein